MSRAMQGKVVVVTGANSGIGRATAQALAGLGATVLACGRSAEKIEAAVAEVRASTGNAEVHALVADLSVMAQVRDLAQAIRQRTDRVDVLINNAGIGSDRRVMTEDGVELTFAVNHLAPFVLTTELLPLLEASAPARVVTVSSAMYTSVKALDLEALVYRRDGYAFQASYGETKLANVLFTRALARRLEGTGVTANCLHPGVIDTAFGDDGDLHGFNALMFRVMKWFLPGPAKGAETSVYLASSPEVEGVSGRYFEKCREKDMSPLAQDDALADRLWERSEGLVAG